MGFNKKTSSHPPFIAMPWAVMNSKAYLNLTPSSAKALPWFFGKVHKSWNHPDRYVIEFIFPYAEAKKKGFAAGTFSKVIGDLVSKGFVDPVDKGGLRGDGKSCNKFRLSTRWEGFATESFKDMNWKCFIPKPRMKNHSTM